MEHLIGFYLRLTTGLVSPPGGRARDERGDVPGWVMVTVMTAGMVMIIWGVAETELRSMLSSALGKVR